MMENSLDTIFVLDSVGVALHHVAERSSRHQKLYFRILMLLEVLFDVIIMIDRSIIQDHQGCDTLGAGAQPHHYFLWKLSSPLNATFFIGISTIYWPHFGHSESYRHHQCRKISRPKREFPWLPLFENCFEPNSQIFSV